MQVEEQQPISKYDATVKIALIDKKLEALRNGDSNSTLKEVLNNIYAKKLKIEGIIFLQKQLLEYKYNPNKWFSNLSLDEYNKWVSNIDYLLEQNSALLQEEYRSLYDLKRRKLELDVNNITLKRNLLAEKEKYLYIASEYSEEEFIDKLVHLFRTNHFSKSCDTYDPLLGYSIGQIFILKYCFYQLENYVNFADSFLLCLQKRILDNYVFMEGKKSKRYIDFINNLENGNLELCDFGGLSISYSSALLLYHKIARSFYFPRMANYVFKRRLK